jgi:hypothetical protein
MRCDNDHYQNLSGQPRRNVKEQNASHYGEKQHIVKHKNFTTTESRNSTYLHLDQPMLDFMEICCEVIMDLSSMIDL